MKVQGLERYYFHYASKKLLRSFFCRKVGGSGAWGGLGFRSSGLRVQGFRACCLRV